jgi:hypothetical protein
VLHKQAAKEKYPGQKSGDAFGGEAFLAKKILHRCPSQNTIFARRLKLKA